MLTILNCKRSTPSSLHVDPLLWCVLRPSSKTPVC